MTYNELYRKLRKAKCFLLRHGRRHDIWQNPRNGKTTEVPRHGTAEVPIGTLKTIYQELGLSPGFSSVKIRVALRLRALVFENYRLWQER